METDSNLKLSKYEIIHKETNIPEV